MEAATVSVLKSESESGQGRSRTRHGTFGWGTDTTERKWINSSVWDKQRTWSSQMKCVRTRGFLRVCVFANNKLIFCETGGLRRAVKCIICMWRYLTTWIQIANKCVCVCVCGWMYIFPFWEEEDIFVGWYHGKWICEFLLRTGRVKICFPLKVTIYNSLAS